MYTISLFIGLVFVGNTQALLTTPVIILDNGLSMGSAGVNPLSPDQTSKFEHIVPLLKEQVVCSIIFIEEKLSTEDISCRDFKGTPFIYLRKNFLDGKVKYLTKVINPYRYLKFQFEEMDLNTFHISSTSTKLHLDKDLKSLFIYFDDVSNETRLESLRKHDVIMNEVVFTVQQLARGPVVAFYIGLRNPVQIKQSRLDSTHQTAIPAVPPKTWSTVSCGNGVFKFFGVLVVQETVTYPIKAVKCEVSRAKDDVGSYEVQFASNKKVTHRIKFKFTRQEKPDKGWKMTEIEWVKSKYNEMARQYISLRSPWNRFYQNTYPVLLRSKKIHEPRIIINLFRVKLRSKLGPRNSVKKNGKKISRDEDDDDDEPEPEPAPAAEPEAEPEGEPAGEPEEEPGAEPGAEPEGEPAAPPEGEPAAEPEAEPESEETSKSPDTSPESADDDKTEEKEILTTLPILTGFFVTGVFTIILSWGVNNLINCNSNSIFDTVDTKALAQSAVD